MRGGQTDQTGPRIGTPMWTKESSKGWYKVQPFVGFGRQIFGIRRGINNLQLVTQPLDGGPGVCHGPFQGILHRLSFHLIRNRCQKTMRTWNGCRAGIHHEEQSRSVGILGLTRGKCRLSKECGLLITQYGRNGYIVNQFHGYRALAINSTGCHDRRQCREGYLVRCTYAVHQLWIPFLRLQIQKEPSTRVGNIRDELSPTTQVGWMVGRCRRHRGRRYLSGQLVHEPRVDGSKANLVGIILQIGP
mmetsp:Transcript_1250/g.2479  ORF Transcript_1250/g.2479 Transcript_1250/m.2479 type:complete len:246 (+) Transcript_1250:684-1421(+)